MDISGWFEIVRLAAVTAAFVVVFYRVTEWIKIRACSGRMLREVQESKTIGRVDLTALVAMEQRFQTRAAAMERAAEKAASVGLKCWGEVAALKIELDTLRTLLAAFVREVSTGEGPIDPASLDRIVAAARSAGVYDPTCADDSIASERPAIEVCEAWVSPEELDGIPSSERPTWTGMHDLAKMRERQTLPSASIPLPS
jgi:nucleotide-binding universal stress UspA family protein